MRPLRYPHPVTFRLGEEHKQVLDLAWEKHRVRPHDFMRAAILRQKIVAAPPPPPEVNTEVARLISKMSVNLNQIARRWNQYPMEGITRKELDDLHAGLAFVAAVLLGHESSVGPLMRAGISGIIAAGEESLAPKSPDKGGGP